MAVALELEHAIGFGSGVVGGLHLAHDGRTIIHAAGACVVKSKLDDPHDQVFLRGHDGPVTTIAVSRSDATIASGQEGDSADVVVWNAATGEIYYRFEEHDARIAALCFSDDERVLMSSGNGSDGKIFFWDMATGHIIARSACAPDIVACVVAGGMVRDVKRRPTGLYQFASVGRGGASLWALNPITGDVEMARVAVGSKDKPTRDLRTALFSPDCSLLWCGATSGELLCIDVRHRSVIRTEFAASAGVFSLGFLDDHQLLVGGGDGSVTLFAVEMSASSLTITPQRRVMLSGPVSAITCLSESGRILAGTETGVVCEIAIDDAAGSMAVVDRTGARGTAGATATSGRRAASATATAAGGAGGGRGGGTSAIPVRGLAARTVLESHGPPRSAVGEGVGAGGSGVAAAAGAIPESALRLAGSLTGSVVDVSFAANVSDSFATAADDCTVRVWNASSYAVAAIAEEKGVGRPLSLNFLSEVLVTGWEDGAVRGHLADDGSELWTIASAHRGGVTSVTSANNQRFLVSGGADGSVRVWEIRSREMVGDLREHTSAVTQIQVYSDDAHAVSCSRDRSLLCWDLRRERRISSHTQRMGGIHGIALSRDQSLVLSVGQEKKITYWDLREPQPVQVVSPVHGDDEATCIAVAHHSDLFVTGGGDSAVKLWDLRTGRALETGRGHSGRVRRVAFSPDDRQVVSVGEDGCVLVWNLYTDLPAP